MGLNSTVDVHKCYRVHVNRVLIYLFRKAKFICAVKTLVIIQRY